MPGAILIAIALFYAAAASAAEHEDDTLLLEEIIVTAQKRGAEDLQDLAMSAAVITSDLIEQRKLVGMDDYLRTIPAVTHQDYGAGRSTTIIRGISADPQEGVETTGVYINESPLTSIGDRGRSSPDLKLIDVNRVEILRGPQGTLYGSSSLGGTVRIIPEPPRLDGFGGSVTGSLSHTGGYGGGNYDIQGVLNIPLIEDELAVRAVAYSYDYSGYYRNVAASDPLKSATAAQTGALALDRDAGDSTYTGGRIAARWAPTDQLTLDFMYLEQQIEQEGVPYGDLRIEEFRHARYSRFSSGRGEYLEDDLSIASAVIDYDFGPVGLLSSTSWIDYESVEDWDVGQFWTFFYVDDAPIYLLNVSITDSFVQELRVTSQWDHPVNFLLGVYYEDRDGGGGQLLEWDGNPADDPLNGQKLAESVESIRFEQLAFFGEVSWDLSDALVATVGVRRFDYDASSSNVFDGFFVGGLFTETLAASEDGDTFKINLSYSPDERSLYYAQWAQGFTPGYPLPDEAPPFCDLDGDGLIDGLGLPAQKQVFSDELDSYEVGGKLSLASGRVDLRGAAFYNEWQKIPINLTGDCGFIFPFNAAEATTTGLELEGSALISEQWLLDFSAGYMKAELAADAPGLGLDGDRLPGVPEFNAKLGLQYDLVFRGRDGYLRADIATVGDFYSNLQEEGQKAGDYTTVSLSAGMDFDPWHVQLFIHNLGDEDAPTWVSKFDEYPSAYRLRPRTIGASVRYRFGDRN